ncbi:TraB/GumN family protein [Zeaxanthinibacter sp. PT1]|uniref:TraB/GumN family protein n=1 Tax=Zeaxanthinibacter TaxID=561554 RepID=UPI00234B3C90|nr:TraB/GumN family protein [Zeaxanthinibacter sp. PT1]MDC6350508.1 TraB/GumN family protein [Zeaxanthinibacter sp. PT1]
MRWLLPLLWTCFIIPSWSQDNNSLLWEISGNGLEQTSYLYGTMHVSKKIAFHLDDVFYDALDQSEVIALESDPATWLENDSETGTLSRAGKIGFNPKGFYTDAFAMRAPGKKDIANFIASEDGLVNSILYRTDQYAQDFEEDTYLDMFIYRAGSKFHKPILALEDLEESGTLVALASMNAMKKKPDAWLQERIQQGNLMSLMQDAYRERNISLLDSIDKAMYTDHYLENMLYIRNRNMVHKLDSAIRHQKVFAGIGAAHLPGEEGVLELLRSKGYQVRPLVSASSKKGQELKHKFVQTFREPHGYPQTTDDEFFSLDLPAPLYPVVEKAHTTYISPDLPNGAYLMVHRIPTYRFLNPEAALEIHDLEDMLFENIPGTILEKTIIEKQGFKGLDLKNRLKNGDHQHYQIFQTPLEILVFKLAGEGDYSARFGPALFNSLRFNIPDEKKISLRSGFNSFQVSMPGLHRFTNRFRHGNRQLEGYDFANGNYYFLHKVTLNDFDYIESDAFELKQIQSRFYQAYGINGEFLEESPNSLVSSANFNDEQGKRVYLKTLKQGNDYYLLGSLGRDETAAQHYLDSFRLSATNYPEEFEKIRDTAMLFTTVSPVMPKKFVEISGQGYTRKKQKDYMPYTKKTVYQYKNNEAITVLLNKSHEFMTIASIDSAWAGRKRRYAKKTFQVSETISRTHPEGHHELQMTLTDTASSRFILVKNVIKGSLLYELKAGGDSLQPLSPFVKEFFDNFRPMDTLVGRELTEDKTNDFFSALRANDSIVLDGYRYLLFTESHADSLMQILSTFEFPEDKAHIRTHLLRQLGRMELPEVEKFLLNYYEESYSDAMAQSKILQAITQKNSQDAAEQLMSLLSKDLPLASNVYEINKIFAPFRDSLPMARELFPELLAYHPIEEYKEPVLALLSGLLSKELIRPKHYKKYKTAMLNDARMQLKRQLALEAEPGQKQSRKQRQFRKLLHDYVIVLFPFRSDKNVSAFFEKLSWVEDARIQARMIALKAAVNENIPNSIITDLAQDKNSRILLYEMLDEAGHLSLIPDEYRKPEALAEAALFEDSTYHPDFDTVQYIESRTIENDGSSYTAFYFKKKNKLDYYKDFKMHVVIYKAGELAGIDPVYRNDGLRIADIESDAEIMDRVTEAFLIRDRPRAVVFDPDAYHGYAQFGY